MKIYQIGGCVRDELLAKKPHDVDYVVVQSNIDEMLSLGYKQVGKNFPVFLHPQTKEEYALARKEVKTGDKHTDFKFIFDSFVTLEEDIMRRDFTINALARDMKTGELIDFVGGLNDIKQKVIRHVNSEHFGEDPLRVLRMCRFAAQLNFTIAPETMLIAQKMVAAGMVDYLTPERIWKEIEKALQTEHFEKFIYAARECGALNVILPEVNMLWLIPEKLQHHPEKNSGEHTMLTIIKAAKLSAKIKFALLLHDIGKIKTPKEILPAHHRHDENGLAVIEQICNRLKIPNEYKNFALLCCRHHMNFYNLLIMKKNKLLDYIDSISRNFKDKKLMTEFIEVCRCDMLGRAKNIEKEQQISFNSAADLCYEIFNKAKNVHANEMPNFDKLTKNQNFSALYKNYLLKRIFK